MKRVAYIGGQKMPSVGRQWGGTLATNYCFQKAFENDPDWHIDLLARENIGSADDIKQFCVGADVVHLDDAGTCGTMYLAGLATPDVIGPITRSPVKNYKGWDCPYPEHWFYRARVIRLNYAEERACPERVTLILHGVNTELLQPVPNPKRKLILWAGAAQRFAKNYELWQQITSAPAPHGFEWCTLSSYRVCDYWDTLDHAAVLVNTSKYESFCCAAFEAMAKGVPVIWREGLQGAGVHEGAGLRVEYEPEAYREAIRYVLGNPSPHEISARMYVEGHCTLKHMRDSYAAVYEEVVRGLK